MFVSVVLFLEFSQCGDAEKSAILSNFSKTRSNLIIRLTLLVR